MSSTCTCTCSVVAQNSSIFRICRRCVSGALAAYYFTSMIIMVKVGVRRTYMYMLHMYNVHGTWLYIRLTAWNKLVSSELVRVVLGYIIPWLYMYSVCFHQLHVYSVYCVPWMVHGVRPAESLDIPLAYRTCSIGRGNNNYIAYSTDTLLKIRHQRYTVAQAVLTVQYHVLSTRCCTLHVHVLPV